MPGKNDVTGYQNRAVKLGYAVRFEIRTIGNYYDRYDFLQIIPTFYFVDKEGKNRQEVDLYYSTPSAPLIKIGSDRDTLTNTMKMDFKRRGIDLKEFSDTAGAMHRIRGGMNDYSLEEWVDIFPQISKNGVTAYKFSKVLLSEPVRSYLGPLRNIPEGVNTDKALASSSPVFLQDGCIVVNFRDISVINDDDFENPSLKYTGKTGDGWSLEGYVTNQNGWELEPGDVVVYYADKRATDDYFSAGTH